MIKSLLRVLAPSEKELFARVALNSPSRFIPEFYPTSSRLGAKLSAWIRNRNEQQAEVPLINSLDISEGLPDYSPREKQIILLQNIVRKTEYPGKGVKIVPEYDIPLAWASAEEEFMYYINSLINETCCAYWETQPILNPTGKLDDSDIFCCNNRQWLGLSRTTRSAY